MNSLAETSFVQFKLLNDIERNGRSLGGRTVSTSKDRDKSKERTEGTTEENNELQRRKEELQLSARKLLSTRSSSTTTSSTSSATEIEPEELTKLTQFHLKLRITETTVGAIKIGLNALGVQFLSERFEGESLFGRDVTAIGS